MKVLACVCFMAVCVAAASANEESNEYLKETASAELVSKVVNMLMEVARSTSYSSLLTLNITNVLILAFLAYVGLSYFGFVPFTLGRSSDSWTVDLSALGNAVASVAPLVQDALEYYSELEQQVQRQ